MSVEIIRSFYEAFSRRDAEGMVTHYADDVRFSDPVFRDLHGEDAKNMWRMLCERGKDLAVVFRDVASDGATGSAHWDADYTFGATGKKVHNEIDAAFTFEGGKIKTHTDGFDLRRWAGMALGVPGKLFGWAPFLQNAVRKKGMAGLADFGAKRAAAKASAP